jgi:uncharacterized protein
MNMNHRFYPDRIDKFEHEPDRERFKITNDAVKGNGIVTLVPFSKNDIVFRFAGDILTYQTLFTLQIGKDTYLHDPYFMGKVLHSCEPNMSCDIGTFTFTALKDIGPEEFLTMDYESTEEELFREFSCCCGSVNCRGLIRGRKYNNKKHNKGKPANYA